LRKHRANSLHDKIPDYGPHARFMNLIEHRPPFSMDCRCKVLGYVQLGLILGIAAFPQPCKAQATHPDGHPKPSIILIDPPENEFFSKQLIYKNIPIKAHEVVVDEALHTSRSVRSL
jgi:hypothetical protein